MPTNNDDDNLFVEAWQSFNDEVPSEQAAADYLFDSLVIYNKIACACNQPQIIHKPGDRFYSCQNCKKVSWVTSGTLFAGVVKLRAWLGLVWLKERGIAISAVRFSRLVEIAQSTALNIQKRLGMVLETHLDDSTPIVPAQFLSQIIIKRSKETPAQAHPRGEFEESSEEFSQLLDFDQWLNDTSEPQLADLVATYLHNRDSMVASSLTVAAICAAIRGAITYIRFNFHGVSRKCLQLYLASFWCHVDRVRWSHGTVLLACLEHPPIRYKAIVEYMSPPSVRIFALPT